METLSNFPSQVVLQTVRTEGAMLAEDVPCSTRADLDDACARRPAHHGTELHQKGRSGITGKTVCCVYRLLQCDLPRCITSTLCSTQTGSLRGVGRPKAQ